MEHARCNRTVLIISNHYPDNRAGGTFASLAYINSFASLFNRCILIYPDRNKEVESLLHPDIKKVPVPDKRTKIKKGIDVYLGKLHRFSKVASTHIRNSFPDIIVFDTSIVSAGLLKQAINIPARIVCIHHNVESDYLADNPVSILYRLPFKYYISKTEKRVLLSSNLNITLTEEDRLRLIQKYSVNNRVAIQNCGVFEFKNIEPQSSVYENHEKNIKGVWFAITGNLAFPQSQDSIIAFIKKLWPIASSLIPDAQLLIAGRNPTKELKKICDSHDNVFLHPNPETIEGTIAKCDFYISPVDKGSGLKLRNMDGLKTGLPIVAHKISARGYDKIEEKGYFISYDSAESFREAIIRLSNMNVPKEEIIAAYHEVFSFEKGVCRLVQLLEEYNLYE